MLCCRQWPWVACAIARLAPGTARAPADPGVLFPPTNDNDERHELALAKLAFYQLLVTAGQLLTAVGALLLSFGVLRLWMRAPRTPAGSAGVN